jgi:tetratricopeptide (TPR) repeat protein
MGTIKEFSYPEISQRKFITFNAFITLLITGIIFSDIINILHYYFFYSPVMKILLVFAVGGFFVGNLFGRFIFSRFEKFRNIFISAEILTILFSILYFIRIYFGEGDSDFLYTVFFINPYFIVLFILLLSFLIGIKSNYLFKISCGDFIDEKQSITSLIIVSLAGFITGIGIGYAGIFFYMLKYIFIIIPLLIIPTLFFIKFQYNPVPLYAQDYEREKESGTVKNKHRDNLLFTYLNFSFVVIFLFLGQMIFIRFYGDLIYIKFLYIISIFIFIMIGLLIGRYVKSGFFHIYAEITYPIVFLFALFLIFNLHRFVPSYLAILFFLPMAVLFGIVLNQTVFNIMNHYNHRIRFNILEFACFILPVPIILSLQLIYFTNLWFFIVVYFLSLIAVLLPGLHLIASKIKGTMKSAYFIFLLVFIPLIILLHTTFNLPMNSSLFVHQIDNFDELKSVNYNSLFIKQRANITVNDTPIFKVSDSIIRNLKRALVPIVLYRDNDNEKILFIDSNQRFFPNPVIGYFKNVSCVDVLSDQNVDMDKIPVSGRQRYVYDNEYLNFYLRKVLRENKKYSVVVDIPNLLDQQKNVYRFSEEYYKKVNSLLSTNGSSYFVQLYNIPECRPEFFNHSVKNLEKLFKKHVVYHFSNILVILASNSDGAFAVDEEDIDRLNTFIEEKERMREFFYNDVHVLSHLVFTSIKQLRPYMHKLELNPDYLFNKSNEKTISMRMFDDVVKDNTNIFEFIEDTPVNFYLKQNLNNRFRVHETEIDILKKLENAEAYDNYEVETEQLFKLEKLMAYRIHLKEYVSQILSYKEKYYYNEALRFERYKKWRDAKKLYDVVLSINKDNFDANYRMGLLHVTLQDVDNSFRYFSHAMKLKKNHPKVLFQMGVLFFLNDKTQEAIDYFNKAIQQKEKSSALFRYMGLCYEKLGNILIAEDYYAKALIEDPNDTDTKSRLQIIKKKKEEDKLKWQIPPQKSDVEAEQGESIPLPINKSAYDIRLKDDDNSLPLADELNGEDDQQQ